MSGKLKEVRTRIGSVTNTQQITKAMKMVSAAKLRRAQDAILKMRPYALKMTTILGNLAEATKGDVQILFAEERPINKVLMVAITSDRGLCGAFNSNVYKLTRDYVKEHYAEQSARGDVDVMTVGKKAVDAFEREGWSTRREFTELFGHLSFEASTEAADFIKQAFLKGEYDRVDVVFNSFKNAATQILTVEQFLPIAPPERIHDSDITHRMANFIFEPAKETLVAELVPKILNTQFFRYLLDSHASEHGARMTAMDKATENADDLLRELRISYNRARQAAITTELTEIVSGAAALSGA